MLRFYLPPGRSGSLAARQGLICKASPSPNPSITQPTSLLQWLIASQNASPPSLKVERTYQGPDRGWGLVATQDIPADGVILSVPLTAAITSQGVSESEWSVHMVGILLDSLQENQSSPIQPWIDALPTHVPLPWLYWSEDQILELQEPETVAEALHLRNVLTITAQRWPNVAVPQIAWALSLVHSRSFISSGMHVWVPGVDLCNHTLHPNATVRCTHSPDACQGATATEEIAPPQPVRPSSFDLVAGEEGITAGDEVTISYGSWPNDVFLLFFGFIPRGNPNDSVVLFGDLGEVADFVAEEAARTTKRENTWEEGGIESVVETLVQELGGLENDYTRMVVTATGVDGRMLQSLEGALRVPAIWSTGAGPTAAVSLTVPGLIAARCRQLLESFPTSLEEDEITFGTAEDPLRTAIQYRIGKKQILAGALAHFELQK